MQDSDADRDFNPTPKKLSDARLRGEILRSADANAAVVMGALVLGAGAAGGAAVIAAATAARDLLAQADLLARGSGPMVWRKIAVMALPVLPLAVLPGIALLIALAAQRGFAPSARRLAPQWSRINPIAGFGRRFGRTALAEFAKSLLKLVLVGALLGLFLHGRLPQILLSQRLEPAAGTVLMLAQTRSFATAVAVVTATVGVADVLWQWFDFLRRNRMSRQEIVDEHRESEGDPHVKGHRRQRAREIAMNRMMADVPKADVVIVNPTHFAVALRWKRGGGKAPVCVAKGVDAVALRIRDLAAGAGVPVRSDPPAARALHASVEIGQEIRPEHYAAVAAAIRFAEATRRRARGRGGDGAVK